MVHGWPDTHRLWLPVAELLGEELRLVAYDTRGQGESRLTRDDASFALPELAADLFAVLDAVSPDEPVHLLGHDWGSVQAWEAVCEPSAEERVASFTSMSGPNLDHTAAWVRRTLARPTPAGLAGLLGQGVSSSYLPFFVSPLAPPVLRRVADRDGWRRLLQSSEGRPPAPEGLAPTLPRDMVEGLRYYRANLRPGRRSRERRTRVPVVQLVLTRDPAVREAPLTESDRWCERIERRHLPHGHWIPLTAPEVVAEETRRVVRSVAPPGRG
jgi:pimeloyl-ACP methyl ester carboxylesterase